MSQSLTLTTPILAHGETLTVLTFRAATGADLMACGVPMRTSDGGTSADAPIVGALIARLAGIPPSSVGAMAAADWMEAMSIVTGFLVQPTPASSTFISTSAISSAA